MIYNNSSLYSYSNLIQLNQSNILLGKYPSQYTHLSSGVGSTSSECIGLIIDFDASKEPGRRHVVVALHSIPSSGKALYLEIR